VLILVDGHGGGICQSPAVTHISWPVSCSQILGEQYWQRNIITPSALFITTGRQNWDVTNGDTCLLKGINLDIFGRGAEIPRVDGCCLMALRGRLEEIHILKYTEIILRSVSLIRAVEVHTLCELHLVRWSFFHCPYFVQHCCVIDLLADSPPQWHVLRSSLADEHSVLNRQYLTHTVTFLSETQNAEVMPCWLAMRNGASFFPMLRETSKDIHCINLCETVEWKLQVYMHYIYAECIILKHL
jgi:hypothetical protein